MRLDNAFGSRAAPNSPTGTTSSFTTQWLKPKTLGPPYSTLPLGHQAYQMDPFSKHHNPGERQENMRRSTASPFLSLIWQYDWKSRIHAVNTRVRELEQRLTGWYMTLPIANIDDGAQPYHQQPLVDRITYFHFMLAYYGAVIRLQSIVVWMHTLLFLDNNEDESFSSIEIAIDKENVGYVGSTTTRKLGALISFYLVKSDKTSLVLPSTLGNNSRSIHHQRRQRPKTYTARWANWLARTGNENEQTSKVLDSASLQDQMGQHVDLIHDEVSEMAVMAWKRCTEAALAMAEAAKAVMRDSPTTTSRTPTSFISGVALNSPPPLATRQHPSLSKIPPISLPPLMSSRSAQDAKENSGNHDNYNQTGQPYYNNTDQNQSFVGMHLKTAPREEDEPATSFRSPINQQSPHSSPYQQQPHHHHHSSMPSVYGVNDAASHMRFAPFTTEALDLAIKVHQLNVQTILPKWDVITKTGTDSISRVISVTPCTIVEAQNSIQPLVHLLKEIQPYWRMIESRID